MTDLAPSLGFEVADWLEAMLVRGPGDHQGEAFTLDDEALAFILRCYELRPDGVRAHRHVLLSRAKGWGKTELAAALCCAELLGPVRFDGWDAEGRPIGRPVKGAEVLCLATEEAQSGLTYRAAVYMLQNGRAGDEYDLDVGLTRTFHRGPGGGEIRPISASASSKEGFKTTHACADETHLFTTPELHRLFSTVQRNLAKRARGADPWLLETSTAPAAGSDSVASRTLKQWRDGAPHGELLVDARVAAPHHDLTTIDGRVAALAESYGPAAHRMDLEALARLYDSAHVTEADWRRFWLNQEVAPQDAWLPAGAWDAIVADRPLQPGDTITLGFDGSASRDATALVGCRVSDGHLQLLGLWEPSLGVRASGTYVDHAAVNARVHEMCGRFRVVRFYADPFFWQNDLDAWRAALRRVKVEEWRTNRAPSMTQAVNRLTTAILLGDDVSHDGNPDFARHVNNARRLERIGGFVIVKESRDSANRIDCAVAATLAYEARGDTIAKGEQRPGRLITM